MGDGDFLFFTFKTIFGIKKASAKKAIARKARANISIFDNNLGMNYS